MKRSIYVLMLLVAFGMQAQEKEDATRQDLSTQPPSK